MSCCLLMELGFGHSLYTLSKASTCSGVYLTYLLESICCLDSLCIESAIPPRKTPKKTTDKDENREAQEGQRSPKALGFLSQQYWFFSGRLSPPKRASYLLHPDSFSITRMKTQLEKRLKGEPAVFIWDANLEICRERKNHTKPTHRERKQTEKTTAPMANTGQVLSGFFWALFFFSFINKNKTYPLWKRINETAASSF